MAIQILPRVPGWGNILGSGLGQLLGAGLTGAAQGYTQQQQQQQAQQQKKLQQQLLGQTYQQLGLPSGLSALPEQQQLALIKSLSQDGGLQSLLGQTQPDNIQSLLQGLGQPSASQAPSSVQTLGPPVQPQVQAQATEEIFETTTGPSRQPVIEKEKKATVLPKTIKQARKKPNYFLTEQDMQDIQTTPTDFERTPNSKELRKALLKAKTPGVKKQLREMIKDAKSDEKEGLTTTKKFFDKVEDEREGAVNSEFRLSKMEELIKRGKLPPALIASPVQFLKKGIKLGPLGALSIDLSALLGADAQEFEKLSTDFVRDAKKWFGSRLTDTDVRTFLRTVPTLVQTDAGKVRVIHNMRLFNKAALAKAETMKQIIKEHGGMRPTDLQTLVNDRMKTVLDRLAQDFKTFPKLTYAEGAFQPTGVGGLPRKTLSELGLGVGSRLAI